MQAPDLGNPADSLDFFEVHNRFVVALSNDDNRLRKIAQERYPDCRIVGLRAAEFEYPRIAQHAIV